MEQETRPARVTNWTLGVERFSFSLKKVPPPTPDGREGRLFPPEQSWKTALLVTELGFSRNKILRELTPPLARLQSGKAKKRRGLGCRVLARADPE